MTSERSLSSDVVTERDRNARCDCRGPCRSRRRSASSSVAQSFGRDGSRPFAALAAPEGSRLSASGRCARRPRQGDGAFNSRFARRRDRFCRQSLQDAQPEDAGRDWSQLRSAARPRVERQTGKGDGAGQGLRLERPNLWQPIPSRQGHHRHKLERSSLFRLEIHEEPAHRASPLKARSQHPCEH